MRIFRARRENGSGRVPADPKVARRCRPNAEKSDENEKPLMWHMVDSSRFPVHVVVIVVACTYHGGLGQRHVVLFAALLDRRTV